MQYLILKFIIYLLTAFVSLNFLSNFKIQGADPHPFYKNLNKNGYHFVIVIIILFFLGVFDIYHSYYDGIIQAQKIDDLTKNSNQCDSINRQTQNKIGEQTETINQQGRKLDKLEGYLLAKGINPQTLFVTNNYTGIIKQRHLSDIELSKFLLRLKTKGAIVAIQQRGLDNETKFYSREIEDKLMKNGYKIERQVAMQNDEVEGKIFTDTVMIWGEGLPNMYPQYFVLVFPKTDTSQRIN